MSTSEPGLFVTKGMISAIPEFSISINENGEITLDKMIFHTGLDMCPYWLEIAYEHLRITEDIHNKLISATNNADEQLMGDLLQKEFISGMQSIMAGCIAIDSYYASIKDLSEIPKSIMQNWRKNGTARYKQIAETLKNTFNITNDTFDKIREFLKQSFDLRDRAVHPKYGTDLPVLYPEINKITDWRYSAYRYANAKAVVEMSLSIIYRTASIKHNDKKKELKIYCENLVQKLDPIRSKWLEKYGELR